mmetsp:Transcript_58895/g.125079  ORF Transcript_58895/g.125079 Transcript_58895/m.125079 type:complete len:221 (-) Transcript_58895:1498-2160(-)
MKSQFDEIRPRDGSVGARHRHDAGLLGQEVVSALPLGTQELDRAVFCKLGEDRLDFIDFHSCLARGQRGIFIFQFGEILFEGENSNNIRIALFVFLLSRNGGLKRLQPLLHVVKVKILRSLTRVRRRPILAPLRPSAHPQSLRQTLHPLQQFPPSAQNVRHPPRLCEVVRGGRGRGEVLLTRPEAEDVPLVDVAPSHDLVEDVVQRGVGVGNDDGALGGE